MSNIFYLIMFMLFFFCMNQEVPVSGEAAVIKKLLPAAQDISRYLSGMRLFKNCIPCHGEDADGKGELAKTIPNPKPSNFTAPDIMLRSDHDLRFIIDNDGQAAGKNPMMPAWGEVLKTEEIHQLVFFIKIISQYGKVIPKEKLQP